MLPHMSAGYDVVGALRKTVPRGAMIYLVERHHTRSRKLIVDFKVIHEVGGKVRLVSIGRELADLSAVPYVIGRGGLALDAEAAVRIVHELSRVLFGVAGHLETEWV
jgi:hypothetical protein